MKKYIAQRILIAVINGYKKILSPLFPKKCKFTPSCSEYAIGAIVEHGAFVGFFIGIKRIFRCNHFSKGGYDPVPLNINGDYKWLM